MSSETILRMADKDAHRKSIKKDRLISHACFSCALCAEYAVVKALPLSAYNACIAMPFLQLLSQCPGCMSKASATIA